MGFSLTRRLKDIYEVLTPQNENSMRAAERSIAGANLQMARHAQSGRPSYGVLANPQARQRFAQANAPNRFSIVREAPRAAVTSVQDISKNPLAAPLRIRSMAGSLLEKSANAIPEVSDTSSARWVNNAIIRPIKTTERNIGLISQNKNPYTGSVKQQAGQAVQDVVNVASVIPVGRAVTAVGKGGGQLTKRIIAEAKPQAIIGAAIGQGQGLATGLKENYSPIDTAKSVATSGGIGTAAGGTLGAVSPVIGAGARGITNRIRPVKPPQANPVLPPEIASVVQKADTERAVSTAKHPLSVGDAPVPQNAISAEEKTIQQLMKQKNLNRSTAESEYSRMLSESLSPNQSLGDKPKSVLRGSQRSVGDIADDLYKIAGVDTKKGLVHENPLYTKTGVGAIQQGYNRLVNRARDETSDLLRAGINSRNRVVAKTTALPNIGFSNFGQKDALRAIGRQRTSDIENAGQVSNTLLKQFNKEATPDEFKHIYQVLETPEFLARKYGEGTPKLTPDQLSPAELARFEKLIEFNKARNDVNLETGAISPEKHAQYADGMHSPRIYDQDIFGESTAKGGLFDRSASKERRDVNTIADDIFETNIDNPYQASMLRLEAALRNKSNMDALRSYERAGLLVDRPPNKNYSQLEGKKYGEFEGKYLDNQIKSQIEFKQVFNSKLGQATGDLVEAYQGTKLGKLDRLNKATKTILSPATNLGNMGSNIFAFSGAAGVNPATAATRMAQAGKQLVQHDKSFNANVNRALKAGLFSGDTGRQINGKMADEGLKTAGKTAGRKVIDAPGNFYGGTDRAFALGIFNELKSRGLSDADAVRRTHLASQNYANAGRGIQLLADSPVLGKPFARFTPELLRIAKNSAIYNPAGTGAKLGALAYGANKLSELSGETQEERSARESGVGQTQIPGTQRLNQAITGKNEVGNLSLNFAVPKGVPVAGESSINVARLTGLNYPMEPNVNPDEKNAAGKALVRQLQPWADVTRTTADGKEVFAPAQTVSSLTFRPIADQAANRDFMGRQISDPDNKIRSELGKGKSEFENADGTRQGPGKKAELDNRLRSLKASYLPGFNEIDANRSAAKGQPDYYGKVRTQTQAGLRGVGLKTESNSPEARQKRVDIKNFYAGRDAQVKEFLRKNPQLADTYFKFNDSSRDRSTNKKSSDLVTPERWRIVQGETSGKLFNQLKQEALDSNKKDGSPIDPIYTLKGPQLKDALAVRSTAPGENIEKEEILRATTSWYPKFEKDEAAFYDKIADPPKRASANPASPNDRVKSYKDVPQAQQSPLIQQFYKAKAQGEDAGKSFYKANADQLSKDFKAYELSRLKSINSKRQILGLDPIDKKTFTNVTFGYEPDERKVSSQLYFKGKEGTLQTTDGDGYVYSDGRGKYSDAPMSSSGSGKKYFASKGGGGGRKGGRRAGKAKSIRIKRASIKKGKTVRVKKMAKPKTVKIRKSGKLKRVRKQT